MYFLNEYHEENYNYLINMVFPYAKNDPEYNTMAYVQALPDIFRRCKKDPMLKSFPFLWTAKYKDTSYTDQDEEGEKYNVIDFEIIMDDAGKERESKDFSTLSSGYRKMVDFAANLFNSSNEFNLMDGLGTWDNNLVKVYFQAVLLRLEGRQPIEGLNIKID